MPISKLELSQFKPHADCFVECGMAGGDGIQAALDSGFSKIVSIDINPACVRECKDRFKDYLEHTVKLVEGDCGTLLQSVLDNCNESCVIYLDANGWAPQTTSPYNESIAAIKRHGKRDHIIIVDDINSNNDAFANVMAGVRQSLKSGTELNIVRQLQSVNPDYNIYLSDSHAYHLGYTYTAWILIGTTHEYPNLSKV